MSTCRSTAISWHLSEESRDRYHLIVGESPKMKLAVDMARKAAASNSTMLLLGESGTGKELFARFIQNQSERANRPFIAINSVGLSRELLESDLFGHEQGVFTGAHKMKKGKIELANGGTIFFDEIGDISRETQAKLLRFLRTGIRAGRGCHADLRRCQSDRGDQSRSWWRGHRFFRIRKTGLFTAEAQRGRAATKGAQEGLTAEARRSQSSEF